MKVGTRVRLCTPDNPRLDGTLATVRQVEAWGAHVVAPAAATGQYRAGHAEMAPLADTNGHENPTGEVCSRCGSSRMQRTGTCSVCLDCGESGGCG